MGLLDDYPVSAPPVRGPVLFDQRWCDLAFLHWPVEPDTVARYFPPGTRPDVDDHGLTYVALVPFAMRRAGLGRDRPVPYLGNFLETNVRLYSVDRSGRHGVLFRSLDASRAAIVPFARAAVGMPYAWSRMDMTRRGGHVTYELRRRAPRHGVRSRVSLEIGAPVRPTDLEVWLTARWGAHSAVAGRTVWVPNEHGPWPLHEATVRELDDDLLAAAGVSPAGPPLRALWSPGVRARFGRPERVGGAT